LIAVIVVVVVVVLAVVVGRIGWMDGWMLCCCCVRGEGKGGDLLPLRTLPNWLLLSRLFLLSLPRLVKVCVCCFPFSCWARDVRLM
jgi:hypothetical protein